MWWKDPDRVKEYEEWFRLHKETAEFEHYSDWNNACNLKYFSKDFVREFIDKFTWIKTENLVILHMLGNDFYKEVKGEEYDTKRWY